MKIVGSFKDYYDRASAFGYDPYPLYVRERREFDISWEGVEKSPNRDINKQMSKAAANASIILHTMPRLPLSRIIVVAFCGKVYPIYEFEDNFYYTFDSLDLAVRKFCLKYKEFPSEAVKCLDMVGTYRNWG